jgi:hypothetical protein
MGYVGNHAKRNHNRPERRTAGARRLIKVREYRDRHGLHLPIGPR